MSQKISEMPAAATFGVLDVLAALEGGANVQCTRDVFLTQVSADEMGLSSALTPTSFIGFDTAGQLLFRVPNTSAWIVQHAGTPVFTLSGSGDWTWAIDTANSWLVSTSIGGSFGFLAGGNLNVIPAAGGVVLLQVNPSTPANWLGSPPSDLNNAIDRIAAAVAGLLGGGIP